MIAIEALVGKILPLVNAGFQIMETANKLSNIYDKAKAEGRTELTEEEWKQVVELDDSAKAQLDAAIKRHGG